MAMGIAALLCVGCLELEETVTIRPDGSGTQTMHMKMSRKMLRRLQTQSAAATMQKQDVAAIFDKKKTKAEVEAAGLSMQQHRVRERRSSQAVDVEVSFADVATLAKSPLTGGRADWILKNGGPGKTGLFFFPMGKTAWKDTQKRIAAYRKAPKSPRIEQFFRRKKAEMSGLKLKFTLALPGRVLRMSKNLELGKDGKHVIARISHSAMRTPEDLMRLLAPCYFVEFDSRNCSFGPNPGRAPVRGAKPTATAPAKAVAPVAASAKK